MASLILSYDSESETVLFVYYIQPFFLLLNVDNIMFAAFCLFCRHKF